MNRRGFFARFAGVAAAIGLIRFSKPIYLDLRLDNTQLLSATKDGIMVVEPPPEGHHYVIRSINFQSNYSIEVVKEWD